MLQGITLVPLGMELVDKKKLLLLSLYTVSFLAVSVIIIHVRKKYFTELLSTRRLTIQLNSVLSRSKCYNLQASFYEQW